MVGHVDKGHGKNNPAGFRFVCGLIYAGAYQAGYVHGDVSPQTGKTASKVAELLPAAALTD